MRSLIFFVLLILIAAALPKLLPATTVLWDWLNGIGLCALGVIVGLAWDAQSPARAPAVHLHRNLAIVATALICIHTFGLLLADSILLEYLKPRTPGYMLAGIVGLLLAGTLTITSLPVAMQWSYGTFGGFQRWHIVLSVSLLVVSLWHVAGTGFLFGSWPKGSMLVFICAAPVLFAYLRRHSSPSKAVLPPARTRSGQVARRSATPQRQAWIALLFCLLAAAVYSGLKHA